MDHETCLRALDSLDRACAQTVTALAAADDPVEVAGLCQQLDYLDTGYLRLHDLLMKRASSTAL